MLHSQVLKAVRWVGIAVRSEANRRDRDHVAVGDPEGEEVQYDHANLEGALQIVASCLQVPSNEHGIGEDGGGVLMATRVVAVCVSHQDG